ncbi:glutamate-5-semialdehyde dehydrogenase [Acuticoccus kandeliae]|uniref:glutamate-5-semialdehyde dehydrogenase n=1 Tax=Acuticoccus kandeliae TaxID=2073160 RepID=UPI000D3EB7B7|nr:glutamate-5-semialdehyde dehydrogenase [Acuticoccus kandeliae]
MSAILPLSRGPTDDPVAVVAELGRRARLAQRALARASTEAKRAGLTAMAAAIRASSAEIMAANEADLAAMEPGSAFYDRARLDADRLEGVAAAVEAVAALPDPVGRVLASWERPNGLLIERVATPLGVIGVIYESRPNVTADASSLALMSGNAIILRSGSDTARTATAIADALRQGLASVDLPVDAIQLVPTQDRGAVGAMLAGASGGIDVIVPRGGRSLVERVEKEARVPVFAHLEGLCHVYVDRHADRAMAVAVVLNAKMRRTGICGAAETLLIDAAIADSHLPAIATALADAGCELRGDAEARVITPMHPATETDFATEYLAPILSVAVVDGIEGALDHIARYSSHHTEAIVTNDEPTAMRFLDEVDSAIVLHNASTQFADGGEFGMGAEIGIATGRFHARGPVGLEQLTTFKYCVHGQGQTRP